MGFFHRESLIELLAKESGYLLTEREGDYFEIRADDGTPMRYLSIRCRDDQPYVIFWVLFPVRFPVSAISSDLLVGLLMRNRVVYFGRWCVNVIGSCELSLSLHYTAIKAGLTAARFTEICREMIGEREALHGELRNQIAHMGLGALPQSRSVIHHDTSGRQLPPASGQKITWLGQR